MFFSSRETVCVPKTLCATSMDMQNGNKDAGIDI